MDGGHTPSPGGSRGEETQPTLPTLLPEEQVTDLERHRTRLREDMDTRGDWELLVRASGAHLMHRWQLEQQVQQMQCAE